VDESSKLMRSVSHGHHTMPEAALGTGGAKNLNAGASSEAKLDRRSNSGKNGRPKKGGGGGKGTWGSFLSADGVLQVDRNDPNYDSEEVCYASVFLQEAGPFDVNNQYWILSSMSFQFLKYPSPVLGLASTGIQSATLCDSFTVSPYVHDVVGHMAC
jgi:hypothetical protein